MRKIKDVLRLKLEAQLSHERIAALLGISKGVVTKYVALAGAAGLDWSQAQLPLKPLEKLLAARHWVTDLAHWYNQHRHSAIGFVTPAQRHAGLGRGLLDARTLVYEQARQANPQRWSGQTRQWPAAPSTGLAARAQHEDDGFEHQARAFGLAPRAALAHIGLVCGALAQRHQRLDPLPKFIRYFPGVRSAH